MIPFNSSSAQGRHAINRDGSYPVYCFQCREFIGTTYTKVHRALCMICQASEDGVLLTEDAIKAYRGSKHSRVDVSMLLVPEEMPKVEGLEKKFTLRSLGGDVMQALGNFALKAGTVLKAAVATETKASVAIAKSKRRGRLFSGVNLGSMEDIDKLTKDKR